MGSMSMTGYTKLFGSIVASTIWRESKETKIVWITMLAMANKNGIVEASMPGLADMARVTIEECESALADLSAPDKYSRTKEHEGRRIEEVDGGWSVLNHAKYRAKMNADERREYLAEKQREHRERVRQHGVNTCQQTDTASTHTEADTQTNTEPESFKRVSISAEEFMDIWNLLPSPFKKIRTMSPGRKTALRAREHDNFWITNVDEGFLKMAESEFMKGKNDRGWIADVDFFLRPDSMAKILEGKYDRKNSSVHNRNGLTEDFSYLKTEEV